MVIRYLLDEHFNPAYRSQLVRREPELVVRIISDLDAPSKGTLDPEILIWCETNEFILVTNNRKSMPGHLADIWLQVAIFLEFSRSMQTKALGKPLKN